MLSRDLVLQWRGGGGKCRTRGFSSVPPCLVQKSPTLSGAACAEHPPQPSVQGGWWPAVSSQGPQGADTLTHEPARTRTGTAEGTASAFPFSA